MILIQMPGGGGQSKYLALYPIRGGVPIHQGDKSPVRTRGFYCAAGAAFTGFLGSMSASCAVL
jgi:hypothetical protein